MNIRDYRTGDQVTNEIALVVTDQNGDITNYVYVYSDSPIVSPKQLDETQLQQITQSHNFTIQQEAQDIQGDLQIINASMIVLIIAVFAVFGSLVVAPLIRSLHGRD